MIVNQQLHTQHQHQHHQRQQQRQQLQCSSPTITILEQLRGGDNIAATSATTAISTTATVNSLLQALDIFGTVVFAFSGALKAGKKGMDIIGMMIISCITAVGGGTLRDVLMMGHHHIDSSSSSSSLSSFDPVVFWMRTPLYIEISCITAVLTYYFWPKISKRFGFEDNFICTSDALGLAAFCVVGVQQATKRGLAPTLCVVSGLMTATFGGIIRDVICGEQPRIMVRRGYRVTYAMLPIIFLLTVLFVFFCLKNDQIVSYRIVSYRTLHLYNIISYFCFCFCFILSYLKFLIRVSIHIEPCMH
jgi:uncharacterized membrane protein YeiH